MKFTRTTEAPEGLKPYVFHGVDIDYKDGQKNAMGTCPFCSREGKFGVNVDTSVWRCLVCNTGSDNGKGNQGGNASTFVRLLYQAAVERPPSRQEYVSLSVSRRISVRTLTEWGVVKSPLTGEWMVPGFSPEGKLNQLYKYAKVGSGEEARFRLLATPGLNHQLYGVNLYDPGKAGVVVCEGPWDAMALWEATEEVGKGDEYSVLAVPGCGTFASHWCQLMCGKRVILAYDNDHPRTNPVSQKLIDPAAYSGVLRVAALLRGFREPPVSVRFVKWGDDGYSRERKSGFDVRDLLTAGGSARPGIGWIPRKEVVAQNLAELLSLVADVPDTGGQRAGHPQAGGNGHHAANGRAESKVAGKEEEKGVGIEPCSDWKELILAWRRAMRWTDGLERALAVMLSCVVSTKSVGDQLWCKVLGPASCGKSTLCEALSANTEYVVAKSTIRGFHSGFKSDESGQIDNSLIAQLYGKTLVTKDGDTLLTSPNLAQILAEARDLYDSTSRTHYRHGLQRDYQGVRMTWILCGTSSLRALDSSELGERFLDCVIMDKIDDDLEDDINWRVANRARRNLSMESNGKVETQIDPDLVKAMRLTGGYIAHLRTNAQTILSSVTVTDDAARECMKLAKFVAYMRARPSTRQDESAEREFSGRLVSQMIRLAGCLSGVMGRKEADDEVMSKVRRVALDTARGRSMVLAKYMYQAGQEGVESRALAIWTNEAEEKCKSLLRFLRVIGVAETFQKKIGAGMTTRPRWRLTDRVHRLYGSVVHGDAGVAGGDGNADPNEET